MTLKELQQKLQAKREALKAIFEQAKAKDSDGNAVLDFRQVKGLGEEIDKLEGVAKSVRIAEHVRSLNDEINDLAEQGETISAAEKAAAEFDRAERDRKRPPHPDPGDGTKQTKTLGQLVTEHPQYEAAAKGGGGRIQFEIPEYRILTGGQKTIFQTTAGWAPETTRTGMVVPAVVRPIQIIDIMPSVPTGQAAVVYMEETTRTHSAAEIAEGGAYPEDAYALTERTSTVRKIGTSIPVTDEQLADVPFARAYLDERMVFGCRQRLDGQIINGDGIAPNLLGILNVVGIQTQAKGGDTDLDAIYKAIDLVRVTGRAMPTHVVMHSTDWQAIRLLQTADGIYIYGSPSEAGPERIWGLPLVKNEALTVTNALVGSFEMSWIFLAERAGIIIEVGYVNDDFTDGRRTIRAQGRWAMVVTRPAAFCEVTGL